MIKNVDSAEETKRRGSIILDSMRVDAMRADGYENTLSGLGVGGRVGANRFQAPNALGENDLKDLYDGNWLAKRIVEALPDDALGTSLVGDSKKLAPFTRLNSDNRFPNGVLKHGLAMGRLCGGAVIVLGLFGSGAPLEAPIPLDENGLPSAGKVEFLEVLTKFDLESVQAYKDDPNPIKNGRTEIFKVKNGRLKDLRIHESRMIFCEGVTKARLTDNQQDKDFPWNSCLQAVHETLGVYGISWTGIGHLIQESSMAWLKLRGLGDLLTTENRAVVEERMNLISTGRQVARTIFLDAGDGSGNGEEFGRTNVSFSDLPQLMQEEMLLICGAAGMPATKLFGRSPAGMNATGESDLRQWHDNVTGYRTNSVKPKLDALLAVTGSSAEYQFQPLWEPTAAELAEIRAKNAASDQQYFAMGVVEPDHILESRGNDKTLGLTFDFQKELNERAKAKTGPTIQVTPTDNAKVVTFNELRENQGKGPLLIPGTTTPDPDGDLPLFVYELKKTKEIEAQFAPTPTTDPNAPGAGANAAPPGQVPPENGGPDADRQDPKPGGGDAPASN